MNPAIFLNRIEPVTMSKKLFNQMQKKAVMFIWDMKIPFIPAWCRLPSNVHIFEPL
jgi:hypothetical protein